MCYCNYFWWYFSIKSMGLIRCIQEKCRLSAIVGSIWQSPWPNFRAIVLTFDYENKSHLMTFGTRCASKKFGQFFMGHLELVFHRLTFFKGENPILSNIVIGMQILYWFENTKEPMSENQYLSQYVVGLPSKVTA